MNSYLTIAEADEIIRGTYKSFDPEYVMWNGMSADDRTAMINSATIKLENGLMFLGSKLNKLQDPQFPRFIKGRVVQCPDVYKMSILRQGLLDSLAAGDETLSLSDKGVKQYSVEGSSITFKGTDSTDKFAVDGKGLRISAVCLLRQYIY